MDVPQLLFLKCIDGIYFRCGVETQERRAIPQTPSGGGVFPDPIFSGRSGWSVSSRTLDSVHCCCHVCSVCVCVYVCAYAYAYLRMYVSRCVCMCVYVMC